MMRSLTLEIDLKNNLNSIHHFDLHFYKIKYSCQDNGSWRPFEAFSKG